MTGPAGARPAGWRGLRFVAAFVLINTLLTFENVAPGLGVHASPRLSFELCAGLLALLGLVAWRGRLPRGVAGGLAVLVTLMAVGRYLDVTAAAVYGRPLQLYWDGRHALEVLRLADAGLQPGWLAAAALALLVLLALTGWIVHRCIGVLAEGLAWPAGQPVLALAGAALVASFVAYPYTARDTRWFFSLPVLPTLAAQARMLPAWAGLGPSRLTPGPAFDGGLDGLRGADVLLLFAESYGVTALDDGGALEAPRRRLLDALQAGGREVVSARLRSPTFGGGSWLAHAALLSGVDTQRPDDYERLLASGRPTLVSHFARHGYRTVGWMPGLQQAWPEGAFYGFDRLADGPSIGYRGPAFGGWRVPDQAAMVQLHAQELARSDGRPRLVVFPTINSHAPFRPLPPFQPDWPRLLGDAPYAAGDVAAAMARPVSWFEPREAYLESIGYLFDWLGDYLRHIAGRQLLVIVVGDHQPLAAASGAAASWDVPVHVIGGDAALRSRLLDAGFVAGLKPPARSLGPMHTLTPVLAQAFAGGHAVPAAAAGQ